MAKISDYTIPLDYYRPSIANYRPPLARRPPNCARRMFGEPMAPESIQGNRHLCPFIIDSSSGKNVLKITIPGSKTSIGIEMVPRWGETTGKMFPRALFFHLTEKGPQEFEFPTDRMLMVRGSEILALAMGVSCRDLEMHAVLWDNGAWRIRPVDRESISRLTSGEPDYAFIFKSGIFSPYDISEVKIFG